MYLAIIRSILFIGAVTACSDHNDPYTDGQEPLSTTTNPTATYDAGTGHEETDCTQVACPPPPTDWCESGGSGTSLPSWLVEYWDLSCAAGVCGDGLLNDEEVCDDGNTVGGDGCSADCSSVE